mmetsp:Transcript_11042/g.17002  ORF Transcript_11042/g.17002 Transcript_11042/m.17002 type:complete len:634 (+) Transcript_11042:2732-4633(+)
MHLLVPFRHKQLRMSTRSHYQIEIVIDNTTTQRVQAMSIAPRLSTVVIFDAMLLLTAATRLGLVAANNSNVFHLPLKLHHATNIAGRALLEGSSGSNLAHQQIDALYQGYGTHYIDLWVGTPPQRQTVIVATGSPKTAFPCSKCRSCGELYHTDGYFLEKDSSTYRAFEKCNCIFGSCSNQQCRMSTSYSEGSMWSGIEGMDTTYAGGPHNKIQQLPGTFDEKDKDDADPLRAPNFAFDHIFACMDEQKGLFRTQMADGIMGMDNAPESFWYQAYNAGVIEKKAFALCLSRQSDPKKQGTEAGALTMGGHDQRLHTSPMVYTKLDVTDLFVVTLRRIYLREGGSGDSVVSSSPKQRVTPLPVDDSVYNQYDKVIVESGTTDTFFPLGLSSAFKREWEALTGKAYSHERMFLTQEELDSLPTILLQLEGSVELNQKVAGSVDPNKIPGLAASIDPEHPYDIVIAIPPSHYMEAEKHGGYTARFYVDEYGRTATVGANSMMGHDILFDVEEGAMGFAESHCDYTKLEKEVADEEKGAAEGKTNSPESDIQVKAKNKDNEKRKGKTQQQQASGKGISLTAVMITLLVLGGAAGYVAFERFGLRERFIGERGFHDRLSTNDDKGGTQLELQHVNPIL